MQFLINSKIFRSLKYPVLKHRVLKSTMHNHPLKKEDSEHLVWVDLEMTGLDVQKHHIIEMACIITNSNLDIIAKSPNLVIHQSEEVLNLMDPWCVQNLSQLTEEVRKSNLTIENAEETMVDFLKKHVEPKSCPLAGNSVSTDRSFLLKYMPNFMDMLHYRIVDVSTVKELVRRWYPEEYTLLPKKSCTHRACDDIMESIRELAWYKQHIFKV